MCSIIWQHYQVMKDHSKVPKMHLGFRGLTPFFPISSCTCSNPSTKITWHAQVVEFLANCIWDKNCEVLLFDCHWGTDDWFRKLLLVTTKHPQVAGALADFFASWIINELNLSVYGLDKEFLANCISDKSCELLLFDCVTEFQMTYIESCCLSLLNFHRWREPWPFFLPHE